MVLIFQTDNRPNLDYALLSKDANEKVAQYLKYDYIFKDLNEFPNPRHLHPATLKIFIVNDQLHRLPDGDILIFLDSDAWVQDPIQLGLLITDFINMDKDGMYSRDPYISTNTYINSGSFVLKVNENNRRLYSNIIQDTETDTSHLHEWTYDQYYISKHIYENRERYLIFDPILLNTPKGIIFRHNWFKKTKMYDDLKKIIVNEIKPYTSSKLNYLDYVDMKPYPNEDRVGYEYND